LEYLRAAITMVPTKKDLSTIEKENIF